MEAVLKGFRATVDVKGKLAELYLYRVLLKLRRAGVIESAVWTDKDGQPDFEVVYQGQAYRMECKNIRTPKRAGEPRRAEMQKTRNSRDGSNTRGYKFGDFDLIGVCLFNHTGKWDFLYTTCAEMAPRPGAPEFLVVMQPVPNEPDRCWTKDVKDALDKAAAQRKKAGTSKR